MRKILLGTTAVVGAALLAPAVAVAQEAPTVRIGGFFRAYYGNTQQSGRNSTQHGTCHPGSPATVGSTLPTGVASGTGNLPLDSTGNVARLSKNDFSTDAEVHVFVNGKTANGLSYGAVIEIAFNQQEGRNVVQQRATAGKTTASIDEYYAFVASPRFGQIRFGDEDGPVGGLMNSGVVTNFGSGGIYGDRDPS
ncbi:porin [Paeniroseomonas aquatica]|uniref:porin n=1 Tax=Paeniroseomonas aquatica TaxID=373043 RepID=UPI0036166509